MIRLFPCRIQWGCSCAEYQGFTLIFIGGVPQFLPFGAVYGCSWIYAFAKCHHVMEAMCDVRKLTCHFVIGSTRNYVRSCVNLWMDPRGKPRCRSLIESTWMYGRLPVGLLSSPHGFMEDDVLNCFRVRIDLRKPTCELGIGSTCVYEGLCFPSSLGPRGMYGRPLGLFRPHSTRVITHTTNARLMSLGIQLGLV